MNKRIEKLIIEAFFDESTSIESQKMYTFGEEKMQKFAELIVRECDQYVTKYWDEMEPWMNPGDLLTHFGIEDVD